MLSSEELETGAFYQVASPSFSVAIWDGAEFIGASIVDGAPCFVNERHYDAGLPYGLSSPVRRIGEHRVYPPYSGRNLLSALFAIEECLLEIQDMKMKGASNGAS